MDLNPYLSAIAADLDRATALADEPTRDVSRRVASALEPSLRLAMTHLLSDAAAQLTRDLDDAVVTVRVDGREPVLQVQHSPATTAAEPTLVLPDADESDDGTARVTVRLPEQLKRRAEQLAQAADQSLNTWLVQTVRRATSSTPTETHRSSRRLTGWA